MALHDPLSPPLAPKPGEKLTDIFEGRVFPGGDGQTMPYRLLKPEFYDPEKSYPLVLFFARLMGARQRQRTTAQKRR